MSPRASHLLNGLQAFPPARVLSALELLQDARNYATDLTLPLTEFAVSIQTMRRHFVADIDIRWLLGKGFVQVTQREDATNSPVFPRWTLISLTPQGVAYAARVLSGQDAVDEQPAPAIVSGPFWDGSQRELRLGQQTVKRYRVPAPNQELILETFQEDLWPTHIEDPIPPTRNIDPKRRLHDTILALNRGQAHARIRFRGDGKGSGVCWEIGAQ